MSNKKGEYILLMNHMSLKNNYLKLIKKFGGHQYAIKKGVSKNIIDTIMKDCDIGVSKAYKVAKVLGVSMEELLIGKPAAEVVNETCEEYRSAEEQKYIDKLLAVLRGQDDTKKITVKGVLDMAKQDTWAPEQRADHKKTAQ